MNITLKIDCLNVQILGSEDFQEILTRLTHIERKVDTIIMTDAEVLAVLNQVDATTTKIGANLDTVAAAQASEANVVQSISDEIDALVAGQGANGISDATAAKLTDIANRLQTSSDNSDKVTAAIQAQVPVLTAIAAKGAPVVPAPPPPPPLP